MSNLLKVIGSSIPIGTIIQAVGPPDSTWLKCDGSILNQSEYPGYVDNCDDLHPMMWRDWYWIDVDQSVVGASKYAINRMGNTIVLVGSGSEVWVSTNQGVSWTRNTGLTTGSFYCLENNGTRFVTAIRTSTSAYYSTNGATWTVATLPFSATWEHLAYGNGKFVLFHDSKLDPSYYAYSSDGITWYQGTCPYTNEYCQNVSFDGTQFILISTDYNDIYKIHTSSDGTSWSSGTSDFNHGGPDYNREYPLGVHYVNSEYFMSWSDYNTFYFLKFEGTDIKDPDDWTVYPLQQAAVNSWGFNFTAVYYTGTHYVLPSCNSSYDGIIVGKSMNNLSYFRTGIPIYGNEKYGIVHDGENYAVACSSPYRMGAIARSVGVNYNKATQFQLPYEVVPDFNRLYSYIKVAE